MSSSRDGERRMLLVTTILVLMATNSVFAQTSCIDDVQCIEGRFCEQSTFTCRECMDCSELNRSTLPKLEEYTCVKSDFDCGPCLENFTTTQFNSKCVVPEDESFPNIVVCFLCAAFVLLIAHIVILFLFITHKNEYVVVRYCK